MVQNAWKVEEPEERLKLEFLIHKESLLSRRKISIKRLNLTEELGEKLIDTLSGDHGGGVARARNSLLYGTVSLVQWTVPWHEVEEGLDTERHSESSLSTSSLRVKPALPEGHCRREDEESRYQEVRVDQGPEPPGGGDDRFKPGPGACQPNWTSKDTPGKRQGFADEKHLLGRIAGLQKPKS